MNGYMRGWVQTFRSLLSLPNPSFVSRCLHYRMSSLSSAMKRESQRHAPPFNCRGSLSAPASSTSTTAHARRNTLPRRDPTIVDATHNRERRTRKTDEGLYDITDISGICVVAGIDTVGGVRVPAGYCGVFGFKSSHGFISNTWIIPVSSSLDSVGMDTYTCALYTFVV
ncbi:hypothetical protein N665_0303s0028 [Sinapis alba]|nr:hypothetical protein N665_0303s0028 [Sinapis alba]